MAPLTRTDTPYGDVVSRLPTAAAAGSWDVVLYAQPASGWAALRA
jgi:hypothetical protein